MSTQSTTIVAGKREGGEWLTVAQLAARWNISEPTVLRHIGNGLPAMKLGRLYRIHISAVLAKEEQATKPTPKPSGTVDMSEFETADYLG